MTYGLQDLINFSILPNAVKEYINISEICSATYGKCFTIKVTKPSNLGEQFILAFKRSWDLKVFVHNDGEEFWLMASPYGLSTNKFQLKIKSNPEAVMTDLKVAEKLVELYPKSARPCNKSNRREAILKDAFYYRYLLFLLNFKKPIL